MEQPSSSSKVTVEYFDPSAVYQLLSPGLLPRLPLRNLHWESHAGPLRSIQSLHIDLLPNNDSQPLSPTSTSDITRVKSSESTSSGDDGFRTQAVAPAADKERPDSSLNQSRISTKGRRHQIPGLRQTPYLKIFLLRCDDNEIYKSHARKQVREWIKDNTPPAQSTSKINSQENHDAFEWLIIHVVIPNTAAATQSRISAKGGSTIFEKLRADFNGTSKSAIDRVAQIRIGVNDVPYDILPRVIPAIPGSYSESAQENEEAWQDLVSKFKSLILASFDMRVSQYEEDIREKDAQRTLPGWNFCTFFVLKEGLARGFESVGLVEDSLVGYDELSVGLDTIIREKAATGPEAEHGSSFLPYTGDLLRQVENERAILLKESGAPSDDTDGPIDLQSTAESIRPDRDEIPLSASQKKYRDLILSNDISIFDFKCYLFARQLSLLLRMANAWSSREDLLAKLKEQQDSALKGVAARAPPQQASDEAENLTILAEICRRALDFITSISRIIRDDLLASDLSRLRQKHPEVALQDLEELREPLTAQIIENIVSSFTFSVAQQILAQTSTTALPIPTSTIGTSSGSFTGQEPKSAIPEPKTMMHPARTTSLSAIPSVPASGPLSPGIFPGGRSTSSGDISISKSGSTFLRSGIEELASYRAELYLLSRNVLERLGTKRSWFVGWEAVTPWLDARGGKLEEVELHAQKPETTHHDDEEKVQPFLHGLSNRLLRTALDNKDDFYRLYEMLTDKCLRHFTVAGQTQSVQASIADLALLKFHLNDYAAAASFFYRMTPFYGERGWDEIEMRMLVLYSKCLRELKRNEEYVRVTLKLLAKGAAQAKDRMARRSEMTTSRRDASSMGDEISVNGYFEELMTVVPTLQNEVTVPLQYFFAFIEVAEKPLYHESQDSFTLEFRLHNLLDEELNVNKFRAKMVPVSGSHSREIWLENSAPAIIKPGNTRLQLHSNLVVPGTYIIKQIVLTVGKMILSHEVEDKTHALGAVSRFFRSPHIVLYQRPEAFDIRILASRYMHLDRTRSLEVEISSGWNSVLNGELHIRAATAGLRLQTSEVTPLIGKLDIKKAEGGLIQFGPLEPGASARLRLPFSLERELNDITLKIEVSYATDQGTFVYAYNHTVSIILSLGVNVQDAFKHKALFSKFTISSATSSPLRLLSSRLEGSNAFEAFNGGPLSNPLVVFPRQPASLLYKILKRSQTNDRPAGKSSLSLTLDYVNLEEEIDSIVDSVLTESLRATPFWQYSRIVVPTVLSQLHSVLTSYDLERTAISGKLSTSTLSSIKWRRQFVGLGSNRNKDEDVAHRLSDWLETWIKNTPYITLLHVTEPSPEANPNSRQIVIPVDIPSVNVVHTVDLKIPYSKTSPGEVLAFTNEAIAASLSIKWTRMWDTRSKVEEDSELGFVYEVSGSSDTWLIGGKRKGHFKVPANTQASDSSQALEFPVLLIPLRDGYLPYPNLEIKPVQLPKATHPHLDRRAEQSPPGDVVNDGVDKEAAGPAGGILSEVDYKNVGEVIRVISNAQKTTVSLDASGPQGGAWLLEIDRRGTAAGLSAV